MNHLSLTFRISRSAAQWRTNIVRASENWKRSSVKEVDRVDDSHNYVSDMQAEEDGYSSDDCFTFAHGRRMSREHQKEYLRQIKESEGFDITLDLELGEALGGPVFPLRSHNDKPTCIKLSRVSIDKFNKENAQNYEFVEILNMNGGMGGGIWYYIIFNAKDADDVVRTFQALGWKESGSDQYVSFCRLKKSSSHVGDKKSPDSDVGMQ